MDISLKSSFNIFVFQYHDQASEKLRCNRKFNGKENTQLI